MADIGHSPLLKFIVADNKISSMSEPKSTTQVSLDATNIISNVPGEQKLRDGASESNRTKKREESHSQDATEIADDVFETDANNTELKVNAKMEKNTFDNEDIVMGASKEDYVLTPVMTITKEEAVLTKGNMKLQRVSVTEDISVRFQHLFKKQTLPGKTVVTEIQKFEYKY